MISLQKEKDIIRKAQHHPQIFGELYDYYYPKIFGYTLKRVADVASAEDITAATFYKALKALGKFRWSNISFSSWLYRIANHEVINFYRDNNGKIISLDRLMENLDFDLIDQQDLEQEIIEAEEKLQAHQSFLAIHRQIIKLDIKCQEALSLRFFENKKIKQVAEIMGEKEGTVKSWLSRSLAKLREYFSPSPFKKKPAYFTRTQPIRKETVIEVEHT